MDELKKPKKIKKIKKPKQVKKSTVWKYFSLYIRTRDCIATTGTLNKCRCVTCDRIVDFSYLQAGHAIGGRNNSILYDEELVNGQCKLCNGYGGGKYAEYSSWFIKKYGIEKWDEKIALSNQIGKKLDNNYLRDYYKQKYEDLVSNFNKKKYE